MLCISKLRVSASPNQIHPEKAPVPGPVASPGSGEAFPCFNRPKCPRATTHLSSPSGGGDIRPLTHSQIRRSQVPRHANEQSGRSCAHNKLLDLISFSLVGGGGDKTVTILEQSKMGTWIQLQTSVYSTYMKRCYLELTLQKGRCQAATKSPPVRWLHAKSRVVVLSLLPQKVPPNFGTGPNPSLF